MWKMKNQPWTMKNHENQPETIKTNLEPWKTLKTHMEPWKAIKYQPGTMKNHKKQPRSIGAKSGMSQTGGPNWPPLVQKTWRHWHGALTDLLCCKKKRDITDAEPQLTSFGAKIVTSLTLGPNWPPLVQKTLCHCPNRPFKCLDSVFFTNFNW